MLKGLKKAKCEWWRKCADSPCWRNGKEAENCTAKTPDGYCLSNIIDTELSPDPMLYYQL